MNRVILSNEFVVYSRANGDLMSLCHETLPDVHLHTNIFDPATVRVLRQLEAVQDIGDLLIAGRFLEFVGGDTAGAVPVVGDANAQMWAIVGYYAAKSGMSLAFLREVQVHTENAYYAVS